MILNPQFDDDDKLYLPGEPQGRPSAVGNSAPSVPNPECCSHPDRLCRKCRAAASAGMEFSRGRAHYRGRAVGKIRRFESEPLYPPEI